MNSRVTRFSVLIFFLCSLLFLAAVPTSAQDCGDMDGNGMLSIPDLTVLLNYFLQGGTPPVDSALMEFDDRIGITVGDLAAAFDCIPWVCDQFCACGATQAYTYPVSQSDTVFLPSLSSIPADVDSVRLTVYQAIDSRCAYAAYVPYLVYGSSWDSVFVETNAIIKAGDTAIAVTGNTWAGYGRRPLRSMTYVRQRPGVGSLVPQYETWFDNKRLAVARTDTLTFQYESYAPVVMNYEVSLCCGERVGNIDCSSDGVTDIADLNEMVNYLFLYVDEYELCCPAAANCDGDVNGDIDIGDLTALINFLFIDFQPLPYCMY